LTCCAIVGFVESHRRSTVKELAESYLKLAW